MVEFLLKALSLIRKAMIARDTSERGITRQSSASVIARQANGSVGVPLMTVDDLNDAIKL
jgi:hypothetical protein